MGDRNIPGPKADPTSRRDYRGAVPKLILSYPDGVTGAALLLMRLSYALIAFSWLARPWPVAALCVVVILALATGFGTRVAAALLVLALISSLLAARGEAFLLLAASAGGAGALVLLGPGAYSIDAHRFGRRVIRVDPRSPDRGGSG